MRQTKSNLAGRRKQLVSGVYTAIDYWTAILLLTGQITATGVFLSPGGFWLSCTGPIIGGKRLTGSTPATAAGLDAVDIVTALLLILGQVTNTGPWISSGSFNVVISGPAFGVTTVPVPADPAEQIKQFSKEFRRVVVARYVLEED